MPVRIACQRSSLGSSPAAGAEATGGAPQSTSNGSPDHRAAATRAPDGHAAIASPSKIRSSLAPSAFTEHTGTPRRRAAPATISRCSADLPTANGLADTATITVAPAATASAAGSAA